MKSFQIKVPAAVSAVMLTASAWAVDGAAGQSWQTVANFECALSAEVCALAKDPDGNLYAAVHRSDSQTRQHAEVWKSGDGSGQWTNIEDFVSVPDGAARFYSLGADPAGQLYAVGYVTDQQGHTCWLVRRSDVGGGEWTTVDEFALPGGQTTIAQGFAMDARGNLYVAGYGNEPLTDSQPLGRKHWLVRQSRDGSRSWATLEDFGYQHSASAMAILSTPEGLFVAGSGWNGNHESGERWLVRKGTEDAEGNFQWQTVDEFQLEEHPQGFRSQAQGLARDNQGNLYVVGRSYMDVDGRPSGHWVVRRASRAGLDWQLVDTFQLDTGGFAAASGVVADGAGEVYVVGRAVDRESGSGHWIVRHSATGEAGSWSVSDDFRLTAPGPPLDQSMFDEVRKSLRSRAGEWSWGLAMLCNGDQVFAGGSAYNGSGHALVRRLELGRAIELTAGRMP